MPFQPTFGFFTVVKKYLREKIAFACSFCLLIYIIIQSLYPFLFLLFLPPPPPSPRRPDCRYSLAQQKSYEESTGIQSTASETITKSRTGQSFAGKKPTPSQPVSSSNTRTSSPLKYFIPLSPQPTMTPNGYGGSGGFLNTEISMRKQTLLRRMWSREFSAYTILGQLVTATKTSHTSAAESAKEIQYRAGDRDRIVRKVQGAGRAGQEF